MRNNINIKNIVLILSCLFGLIGIYCISSWQGYLFNMFGQIHQLIDLVIGIISLILSLVSYLVFIYMPKTIVNNKGETIKRKDLNKLVSDEYILKDEKDYQNYKKKIYKAKSKKLTTLIIYECEKISDELKIDIDFEKYSFYETEFNNIIIPYNLYVIVIQKNIQVSFPKIVNNISKAGTNAYFISFLYDNDKEILKPFEFEYSHINELSVYQRAIAKFYKQFIKLKEK